MSFFSKSVERFKFASTLYRTEYIGGIGLPVTNVLPEMFVHVMSILSPKKHLCIYKSLPV